VLPVYLAPDYLEADFNDDNDLDQSLPGANLRGKLVNSIF
jgi:hypothetical protein